MAPTVEITLMAKDAVSGVLAPIARSLQVLGDSGIALQARLQLATAQLHDMEAAYAKLASPTETQTVKLQQQRDTVERLSGQYDQHQKKVADLTNEYQKQSNAATANAAAQGKLATALNAITGAAMKAAGADQAFNEEFSRGLSTITNVASSGFKVLTGNFEGLGAALHMIPGPIGEVAGALGDFLGEAITKTQAYAETVEKLSQRIGETAEFTSSFIEASDDMRVSMEDVNNSMTVLARNLSGILDEDSAVATEGRGLAQVFREQGIAGNSFSEVVYSLADRIQVLGPGVESAKLATQAFGRAGQEMLPILLQGSARIKELQKNAQDMGLALDENGVKAMKRSAQAADDLNDRWEAVGRKATIALTPALLSVSGSLSEYLDGVNKATQQGDLFQRSLEGLTYSMQFWGNIISGTHAKVEEATVSVGMGTLHFIEYQQALALTAEQQDQLNHVMNTMTQMITNQTQSGARLTDTQREVNEQWYRLNEATQANIPTAREYNEQTQAVVSRQQELSKIMDQSAVASVKAAIAYGQLPKNMDAATTSAEGLSRAQQQLKKDFDAVGEGAGKLPEKLDKLHKAQLAFELATGKTTPQEVERRFAAEALTKAYNDNHLTLTQLTQAYKDLQGGNPAAPFFALKQAGVGTDVALLKIAQSYREVEKAAGVSDQSMITGIDTLNIITTRTHAVTQATNDLSGAQAAHDVVLQKYNATYANAKWHLDNAKIGLSQFNDIMGPVTKELAAADAVWANAQKTQTGVTTATVQNTAAMDAYVKATGAQITAQEGVNASNKAARELYEKGAITADQLAAVQIHGQQTMEGYRASVDQTKKAMEATTTATGAASDGYVYHSKIVDTASKSTGTLATNVHNIPDAMDKANERTGALTTTIDKLPSDKKVDVAVNVTPLPPEVGMHLFDNFHPTLPPEVTMHLFDNVPTASGATSGALLDPLQKAVQAQAGNLNNVGKSLADGVAAGVKSTSAIADNLNNAVNEAIQYVMMRQGIKSPSTVTAAQIGVPVAQGVAVGITDTAPVVQASLHDMGELGMKGLVQGMLQHEPEVIAALIKIIQDGITQAKAELGIHSPSTVFANMGHMSVAGLAQGITDSAFLVSDAWTKVPGMDFSAPTSALPFMAGEAQPVTTTTPAPAAQGSAPTMFHAQAPIKIHIGTHEIRSELADLVFEAVNQGAF